MTVPLWAQIAAWFLAAVLAILALGSYTMDGTLMAGLHWGWILGGGLLVLGLSVFLAFRFGRVTAVQDGAAERIRHG